MSYAIDPSKHISVHEVIHVLHSNQQISLSDEAVKRITKCRDYLDQTLGNDFGAIYGINTGFGALCNTIIAPDQLETLQKNLLMSHACGMGEEVPTSVVKAMLLLKVIGLSRGHSGVQLQTVQRLVDFYNLDLLPVVYQQGSLGASGDLAPLSHLCLPILGEGEVFFQGKKTSAKEALAAAGLTPQTLKSKEGLALINGTQFMSAYLLTCIWKGQEAIDKAEWIAAMSIDAFDGRPEPFENLTHLVRPHKGQLRVAQNIQNLLQGSAIQQQEKAHVQDPYSLRCIPQVLGASRDAIDYVQSVLETEINSVTDNPIIFPDENRIISGGNFHGQPLAIVLDFLAIALAEVASISERRIYKLISGTRNLPAFLVTDAGLNSGFMIPQYTAAGIVSQNKQLCTPASVDTIDSSNGQEDHVSMGANAATKCYRVLMNLQSVLAIESMAAAQGLELRRPLQSSSKVEQLFSEIRQVVPFVKDDIYMHDAMMAARKLLFS
ncbi:MAG: histidine ammonia-lyase [Flavobacteriales bacterium]|jgi:histidine ammonia-lyase